ncbi:hypothetical protein [Roseomonas indoligenes]|uniref:Uncharacterized protein n=1 Tax=Roseomonas indoligenes TaxID=2820811 RepID=A0A940MYG9_9PROT|nr:hypothetical protein [Pararoseomonas indoligenes]MBP0493365.1 hypothetical protein [Pararoseomonas indoligenes]
MIAPALRRAALAAALALPPAALPVLAPPVLAQSPAPPPGAEEEEPGDPAAAAPAPADLSAGPRPSEPMEVANLVLAPELARQHAGGWRLSGRTGLGEPDHGSRLSIETIGRYLANQSTGRVTVIAQVSGPEDDPSVARRTSLARAITVKASLVRGGLATTRIDLRPMGRTPEGLDVIDILAPPAPRPKEAAAAAPAPRTAPPASGAPRPNPAPRGG